ncbi:RHS repeat-associated core domain-containing protein [Desulforamulus aeronauticus]|nr:RHS repeat-associated core domain-containing protein [Desulforamulus aeronauticus]
MTTKADCTTYDPNIGRFISRDSYEGDITNPLSLNLYTYVENDPLSYVDPSGHSLIGAVIGIGIGVAIGISTGSSRGGSSHSGSRSSGGSSSKGSISVSNSLDFIGSFINLFSGKYSDQWNGVSGAGEGRIPGSIGKVADAGWAQRGNDPYGYGETITFQPFPIPENPGLDLVMFGGGFNIVKGIRGTGEIKNVYNSIKQAPKYPSGFNAVQNGTKKVNVKSQDVLEKLREVESGQWKKIYKDGYDFNGKKISIHYFESQSGKVFDVKVKSGWSNK